ncbi:MAG: septum formation initiator family protein [Patescibacteria group bacterium]
MKLISVIVLVGILVLLGTQIYSFWGRRSELKAEFGELQAKLDRSQADNAKFQAELDYYLNPANLEKELRARFNYKRPGEKLLIIVPRSETTTASN